MKVLCRILTYWLVVLSLLQTISWADDGDFAPKSTNEAVSGKHTTKLRKLRLPAKTADYTSHRLPAHFSEIAADYDNTPANNPITNDGATLGRVLFYDKTLSANGTTSCASCHKQSLAFTDDRKLSVGFDGRAVSRNSMSLVNVRYFRSGKMFWDERAATLEQQVLMPIENQIEMGHDLDIVVTQLAADPIYPPLFKRAFGDSRITRLLIARALAQFVRSIVSYQSKYDVGRAEVESVLDPFPNFSEQENLGKSEFFGRGKCASCHLEQNPIDGPIKQTAFFYAFAPIANGIDAQVTADAPGVDAGVGNVTTRRTDMGRFKVPSLRNIELTGPYMHDGRFHFVEQVIEQYNWSVRPHPNLDSRLQDFANNGMAMPQVEKDALVKFLLTLTDKELVNDEKLSDPFTTD